MSRRAWEEAVRYAYYWRGSELVGYEPVAIPMYRLPLEAVVQKKKPLPAIEEFVLRSVAAGLSSIEDVGGFLGLEPRLAEEAVLSQLQASNLLLQPDLDGARKLRLGPRSVDTLADLATYTTERQDVDVVWDRITRAIVGTTDRELISGYHLQARSLRPSPPGTPPEVQDVSVDEIAAAYAKSEGSALARPRDEAEYELLGIGGIGKPDRRYKLAVVLIYRSKDGRTLNFGISVDGHPSNDHTQAAMKMGSIQYLDVPEADLIAARSLQSALAGQPPAVRARLVDPATTEAAEKEFAASWQRLTDPDVLESPEAREKATARFKDQGASLLAWRTRRVLSWQHRLLLEWAALSARSRLVVCTPAITDEAADHQLLANIEDAANRGVKVTLVLPARGPKPLRSELDVRRRLADLASRRRGIRLIEQPSVTPLLLWDESFVSGSFPWLAHEGDPDLSLITSESVCVTDADLCNELFTQVAGS
jgi:hypothetical protein